MGETSRRLGRLVEHAMSDVELLRSLAGPVLDALAKARAAERERCIAAMVASQKDGFNDPGAEAYYRGILEVGK